MGIKESSDELNPAIITSRAAVARPRPAHSMLDHLAVAIATCGVGYLPLAPGTWGSLVGVAVYAGLYRVFVGTLSALAGQSQLNVWRMDYALIVLGVLASLSVALVGIWAASVTEKLAGKKDPGKVVIDEVAGQMLALAVVPWSLTGWWTIVIAFLAFRFFDIVKPYPARRLEFLESGLGIMADDIVAGAYAGLTVALIMIFVWFR